MRVIFITLHTQNKLTKTYSTFKNFIASHIKSAFFVHTIHNWLNQLGKNRLMPYEAFDIDIYYIQY